MVQFVSVGRRVSDEEHLTAQAIDGDGDAFEDATILQPYGLSAGVPEGSRGVAFLVAGQSEEPVVLCASPIDGARPPIEDGEVIVYTVFGHKLSLKKDGSAELVSSKWPDAGAQIHLADDGAASFVSSAGVGMKLSATGAVSLTSGPGQPVKLGSEAAAIPVAHVGSTLTAGAPVLVWATLVEALLNGLLPGSFTPANSFATTVLPTTFGNVASGSATTKTI